MRVLFCFCFSFMVLQKFSLTSLACLFSPPSQSPFSLHLVLFLTWSCVQEESRYSPLLSSSSYPDSSPPLLLFLTWSWIQEESRYSPLPLIFPSSPSLLLFLTWSEFKRTHVTKGHILKPLSSKAQVFITVFVGVVRISMSTVMALVKSYKFLESEGKETLIRTRLNSPLMTLRNHWCKWRKRLWIPT